MREGGRSNFDWSQHWGIFPYFSRKQKGKQRNWKVFKTKTYSWEGKDIACKKQFSSLWPFKVHSVAERLCEFATESHHYFLHSDASSDTTKSIVGTIWFDLSASQRRLLFLCKLSQNWWVSSEWDWMSQNYQTALPMFWTETGFIWFIMNEDAAANSPIVSVHKIVQIFLIYKGFPQLG